MSKFGAAFERLVLRLCGDRITLRINVATRDAVFLHDIFRCLADPGPDGSAYRVAVSHWLHSQRPPLARFVGAFTLTDIDAPLLEVPRDYPHAMIPIGGWVSGCTGTYELSPFEADDLDRTIRAAIDTTVDAWLRAHPDLAHDPSPVGLDRRHADAWARDQIAAWRPELADDSEHREGFDDPLSDVAEQHPSKPDIASGSACCPDAEGHTGARCAACHREPDID